MRPARNTFPLAVLLAPLACWSAPPQYYGTTEPFASEAVYFVLTDRFVDGDPGNNYVEQGGENRTFDRPLKTPSGVPDNIGYLGGDFKGLLASAGYIQEMGFTALWITPIVDNPDEAFTGGVRVGEGFFADRGKTGYHGYWGVNFYRVDEHLESDDLSFAELAMYLRSRHGIKLVLDVVGNHGSPSYTMPQDQPKFGEIYDNAGKLVADHQNLPPGQLDPKNPLHQWFHREPDLAELSNFDDTNPAVLDYLSGAYLLWIGQGAAAFRIDTLKHMPHAFWKKFSDRIRAQHPGFFMFGESFEYDARKVAAHTRPANGAISVLDFPLRQQLVAIFEKPGSDYRQVLTALHLDDGVYQNPYELMTFYDNHDMARMNASDDGFIDAHHWLFTARGIPVVYYGSEIAFMHGAKEHEGNRNYFGPQNIERARSHRIRTALQRIARIRAASPALQRGLQLNIDIREDRAVFLRVYEKDAVNQSALVLLNKGAAPQRIVVDYPLGFGKWRDADTKEEFTIGVGNTFIETVVPAHGARVLLHEEPNDEPNLKKELDRLMGPNRPR